MTVISADPKEVIRKNENTYFMINFSAGIFFCDHRNCRRGCDNGPGGIAAVG